MAIPPLPKKYQGNTPQEKPKKKGIPDLPIKYQSPLVPQEPEPSTLGKIGGALNEYVATPLIKRFAEMGTQAINVGQAVLGQKPTQPFSGGFLGDVNGFGRVDTTKSPFSPENLQVMKKAAGTGAQIASMVAGGGIVKDAFGNMVKPTIARMALEGAGLNATYGLGQSLAENQGLADTAKNVATQTLAGAVLGPVVGKTLQGVGKLLGKGKVPVSEIGKISNNASELAMKSESVQSSIPITKGKANLPSKKITGEIKIPPPEAKPTLSIKDAMVSLEKQGYSKGQTQAIMGRLMGKHQTSKFTPAQLAEFAREMIPDGKPTFVSTAVIKDRPARPDVIPESVVPVTPEVTPGVSATPSPVVATKVGSEIGRGAEKPVDLRTQSTLEAQRAVTEAEANAGKLVIQSQPKVNQGVQKVTPEKYTKYKKALEQDPEFIPGTDKIKIEAFSKILASNKIDDIIDAIYGVRGKTLPQELPSSSAYNLLRENADMLTTQQKLRLQNKQPLSQAGADLQGAKVKSGKILDNEMDMASMVQSKLDDAVKEKGITNKSLKDFFGDNQCTI